MRRCYLVCYDIRNPKRLRCVNGILKGYGESWQFSVFFCILKKIDIVRLQAALDEQINKNEDQIVIFDLGLSEKDVFDSTIVIGQPLPLRDNGIIII